MCNIFDEIIGNLSCELLINSEENIVNLKTAVYDFLKTIKSLLEDASYNVYTTDITNLVNEINITLQELSEELSINPIEIEYIIKNPGISQDSLNSLETTLKLDKGIEHVDFTDSIYKDAHIAKQIAINNFKYNLRRFILFGDRYVTNTNDFNEGIKTYLKQLVENIVQYLSYIGENVEVSDDLNTDFEAIVNKYANKFTNLSTSDIQNMQTHNPLKFSAFNSYHQLVNFDKFLLLFLGKHIKISKTENKFLDNKYELSPELTNVFWFSETSDEIDTDKSINNISRFIIETCKSYDHKTGLLKSNKFIQFQDFINLMCAINDFAWSTDSLDLITEDGTTLHDLIVTLPNNFKNYSKLFEALLSKKHLLKNFNDEQLNTLFSIDKQIFSETESESLRKLCDIVGYKNGNYLEYIILTANSLTSVKNAMYAFDEDSKLNYLKEIRTSNVDDYLFQLNMELNLVNNPRVKKLEVVNDNGIFTYTFKEGQIYTFGGKTILYNGKSLTDSDFKENSLVLLFLEYILEILLIDQESNDSEFLKTFISYYGNRTLAIKELVEFALRLVKGNYVLQQIEKALANEDNKGKSYRKIIENTTKLYYLKHVPIISKFLKNIDIIPIDKIHTLENLAKAKATIDGVYTRLQVKDSEGNALATSSTSRLMGNVLRQFHDIKQNPNSPASHFKLLSLQLFKGIYSIRDLQYTEFDSKQVIKCNARELSESSFLFDFLNPLLSQINKSGNLVRNGNIAILTSVNSDKNTYAKMLISLNNLCSLLNIPVSEFLKSDDAITKLKELTKTELGTYYARIINAINLDLTDLSKSFTWKNTLGEFKLSYTEESYNELNELLKEKNYNVEDFLAICSEESGVQLNDQLHIIFDKAGNVKINYSLISLYNRYNNLKSEGIPTFEEFFTLKNCEIIQNLIKDRVTFDVHGKTIDSNWVNDSGNLIFGKCIYNDITYNLSNQLDLLQLSKMIPPINGVSVIEDLSIAIGRGAVIQLNPLLEKYNLLDHLLGQEYLLSTVGSHINHPSKAKHTEFVNFISDEASRYQAQHKRNVSQTALVHQFNTNQLNGTPDVYNISVTKDIADHTYNMVGETEDIKPFDGATIVNGPVVHLENFSLNGEKAGITKKLFIHFYDLKFGTGGIIKTAGFGITNSWIRNSPFLARMFKNMNSIPWNEEIDITQGGEVDYNITYRKLNENNEYEYFKIANIHYDGYIDGTNKYTLSIVQLSKNGEEITSNIDPIQVDVNTNYELWEKIFLGTNSVMLTPVHGNTQSYAFNTVFNSDASKTGLFSEHQWLGEGSMLNLTKAMNSVIKDSAIENPTSQNECRQPLKHTMIHYCVTEGAIKQGAANVNKSEVYYKDRTYRFYKIKITQAGIQLDKEHHADNSEVSMMTQVISACAALGYTWDESNSLYKALQQLALQGIKEISNDGLSDNFKNFLTKVLIHQLANGNKTKDGLIYSIMEEVILSYKNDGNMKKDIDLPVSNLAIFDKVQSIVSSVITKMSIKLKFSGILSVLTPSHEIMKLYNGKLRSLYKNFDKEIQEAYESDSNIIPIEKINIGTTYVVKDSYGNERTIHIQSPTIKNDKGVYGDPNIKYMGYYDFKDKFKDGYIIREDLKRGRNLRAYNCFMTTSDGKSYSYYDIKEVREMFFKLGITAQERKVIQNLLNDKIKENGEVEVYLGKEITESGETVDKFEKIFIRSLEIQPFEVIMPKIFKEKLGLKSSDNLSDILENPNFFTQRLLDNLRSEIPLSENKCSLVLKKINGKHVYLIDRTILKDKIKNNENLLKKDNTFDPQIDDKGIYFTDQHGSKLYLSSSKDELYLFDGHEIIVTDNINYYVENYSYSTLKFFDESVFDTIFKDKNITNSSFKFWKKQVNKINSEESDRRKQAETKGETELPYVRSKFKIQKILDGNSKYIESLGNELHVSFKKTLEVIAARIPAQSMQSFMGMKVVAYEDFDINTAYVSTHQIWLQGSDFDIDCVTLLAYELNKSGKFVGWSPHFRLNSEENFKISSNLSYPSGNKLNLSTNYKITLELILLIQLVFEENNDGSIGNLSAAVKLINDLSKEGNFINLEEISANTLVEMAKQINVSEEQIKNYLTWTINLVDEHNLFTVNLELFTKNYIVHQMFNIITNPVNQVQAMTSVDKPTGEAKKISNEFSNKGKALDKATPGNFYNKFEAIESNQVGKDVIGVSAVALKSFFAWTHYVNTILNERQEGDYELELIKNKKVYFLGKEYRLANIRSNTQIFNWLEETPATEDVALKLSALLSLATDNAKELCLAKLNADANMADMYLFGLAVGIDFRTLGKFLMSDFGNLTLQYLKGSVTSEELKFKSIKEVFEFLIEEGTSISPIKDTFGSKVLYNDGSKNITAWKYITSSLFYSSDKSKHFESYFLNLTNNINSGDYMEAQKGGAFGILNFIVDKLDPETCSIVITRIKDDINKRNNGELTNKHLLHRFFDAILETNIAKHKISQISKEFDDAENSFKHLMDGALELNLLGRLCGSNQGIKNKFEDYINFLDNFETLILSRGGNKKSRIDIDLYMSDSTYREEVLKEYDDISLILNPLRVIDTVPHYNGYLKAAYKKHVVLKNSSIYYRSAYKHLGKVRELIGSGKIYAKFRSMAAIIENKLVNLWFLEEGIFFNLPEGCDIVKSTVEDKIGKSEKVENTETRPVYLGTPDNNATFKNWVETYVIPKILKGIISDSNDTEYLFIKNNLFVKSLVPIIYSKNPSHIVSQSWGLRINMSPKNDADKRLLEIIQNAFNNLSIGFTVGNKTIPIKDIFFYYNLITYGNKVGLKTFTKLFESMYVPGSIYGKYNLFISRNDWSEREIEISDTEIEYGVAQKESKFNTFSKVYYYDDPNSLKPVFARSSKDGSMTIPMPDVDYNLYSSIPTQSEIILEIQGLRLKYVLYSSETGYYIKYKDAKIPVNWDINTLKFEFDESMLKEMDDMKNNCGE